MLVGFLAGPAAADIQYPRGCPVCTKHNTPESTVIAHQKQAKELGTPWADENGNPMGGLNPRKGKN